MWSSSKVTLQKSHAFTPKNKLIRSTSYKTSDHRAIQAIISQGDFTKSLTITPGITILFRLENVIFVL